MTINLKSKKILIIEDNPSMRETLIHILGSLGARFIVAAETGVNAITAMKIDNFDVVLCDYNLLGDKTGQQVLDDAKYLKLLPLSTIFIMVTGENRQELVLSAIDNKPDDYLIKPISREQLSSRLERSIARKNYLADIENEIANGNLYQALTNCKQLLDSDDNKMRLHLLKIQAELTIKIGDFKSAGQIYENILYERELPWARLGLGIVAFSLDDVEQAIQTFKDLILQYPAMMDAYDWLVKVYESQGNDDHALFSLNSAVTLSPMSFSRQKKLATLADKTENYAIAKKAYKAVIKLGNNSIRKSPADYAGLANVYLKEKAPDEAQKIVNQLSLEFHNDPEAKLRSALLESEIHLTKGDKELAQQAYEKASFLNKKFNKKLPKELRLNMAKHFYINGNKSACDEIINDLIKTNIDDKFFIKDIVRLCDTIICKNHAIKLINNIRKEFADMNNHGVNLFAKGDTKEAFDIFAEAIAERPDNQAAILNMTRIMIHDLKKSIPDPEKIIKAQSYINKAIEIGLPYSQVSQLQIELDNL
ncbi:MAG: response regulator [Methylobacter sp.]|nr:response regulator [Methylobacter sp.]